DVFENRLELDRLDRKWMVVIDHLQTAAGLPFIGSGSRSAGGDDFVVGNHVDEPIEIVLCLIDETMDAPTLLDPAVAPGSEGPPFGRESLKSGGWIPQVFPRDIRSAELAGNDRNSRAVS